VWEIRNLGFGNRSLQRERRSQHFQAHMNAAQMQDTIAAEVVAAYYRVQYRRRQIEAAEAQVKAAAEAFPLNVKGILGGDLRPIEGQQSIQALVAARTQYLASLIDYNGAQFQLVRAMGQPPEPPNSGPR
jgi:outer membrane protein TolC